MMKDFYYEHTRSSVTENWGDEITGVMLADKLNVPRVSYRVYYAKDDLTRRIFIFRGNCTEFEMETLLGLGFVVAQDGDTENIPDMIIEEDKEMENEI
jgi:hypothetical protein